MDLGAPKGIYRINTLARLNVCAQISTPLAQAELEEFRERFGRPAQSTMLYHWARLIELVYACERVLELLADPEITDPHVRGAVTPGATHRLDGGRTVEIEIFNSQPGPKPKRVGGAETHGPSPPPKFASLISSSQSSLFKLDLTLPCHTRRSLRPSNNPRAVFPMTRSGEPGPPVLTLRETTPRGRKCSLKTIGNYIQAKGISRGTSRVAALTRLSQVCRLQLIGEPWLF